MSMVEDAKRVQISTNYTLFDFVRSATAERNKLTDQYNPSPEVVEALRQLATHVIEPVRAKIGQPLTITSGYRSPSLNRLIGGARNSDHSFGRAVDLQLRLPNGQANNRLIFDTILELNLPFRQLIWEFGTELEPDWVHVAYNAQDNKKQILRALRNQGKTVYVPYRPVVIEKAAIEPGDKAEVDATSLNIRQAPDPKSPTVAKPLAKGTIVQVIRILGGWAEVEVIGIEGWVSAKFLNINGNQAEVTASSLNIRDMPNGEVVAPPLPRGTQLVIIDQAGDWRKVETRQARGFVAAQYLDKLND